MEAVTGFGSRPDSAAHSTRCLKHDGQTATSHRLDNGTPAWSTRRRELAEGSRPVSAWLRRFSTAIARVVDFTQRRAEAVRQKRPAANPQQSPQRGYNMLDLVVRDVAARAPFLATSCTADPMTAYACHRCPSEAHSTHPPIAE